MAYHPHDAYQPAPCVIHPSGSLFTDNEMAVRVKVSHPLRKVPTRMMVVEALHGPWSAWGLRVHRADVCSSGAEPIRHGDEPKLGFWSAVIQVGRYGFCLGLDTTMDPQEGQPRYRTRAWPATTAGSGPPRRLMPHPHFFSGVGAISPLRYPGSKRQLVPVIQSLVKANVPPPKLFVEPFVGGATASLRLVGTGAVERVLLADLDPLVASFWKIAAFDTEWLLKKMYREDVTVKRWTWWREADVPNSQPARRQHLAMKCLFLNRTTFSGILHTRAGPIGGKKQESAHKIDCRFNLATIEKRIKAIGDLAATGRIVDVWCLDYEATLKRLRDQFGHLDIEEVVLYLDPPYVDKAITLYGSSFDEKEHNRLSTTLMLCKYRWLLSYDDSPGIRRRYEMLAATGQHSKPLRPTRVLVEHFYTAAGRGERARRDELVVTNFPNVPDDPRYRRI